MRRITNLVLLSLSLSIPAQGKLFGGIKGVYFKPSDKIYTSSEDTISSFRGFGVEFGYGFRFFEITLDANLTRASKTNAQYNFKTGEDIYQFTPRLIFAPQITRAPINPYLGLGFPYHMTVERIKTVTFQTSTTYNPSPPWGLEPFIGLNYLPLKNLGFRLEGRDQFAKPDIQGIRGVRITAGIYLNT